MPRIYDGNGMQNLGLNTMISGGPPPGFDPKSKGGRVPARWTYPYRQYTMPLLELPQARLARVTLATNGWLGDPIVNASTKLSNSLAFERMVLTVQSKAQTIPEWVKEPYLSRLILDYGEDNPDKIAAAYVKQRCMEQCQYLDIKGFFSGEGLDFDIAGDAFINVASNATPEEEQEVYSDNSRQGTMKRAAQLRAKMMKDGRGEYSIYALQSLNPSAVWIYADYAGRIVDAQVVHLMGEGIWDINLNNLIQLKGSGFNWTLYGVPSYISALKWIDIKFKMMDALFTNANRYITPREWLKVKGPDTPEGGSLPPTEQQMVWAEEILSAYQSGQPFILPEGWDWNYLGAEGKVLKIEGLLEKVDDAIRTACQMSRTFTSGAANVPAYATSKLQAGIMYKTIQTKQDIVARAIEGRILERFCQMNGFFEDDGTLVAPKVEFATPPIQGDDSVEKKLQVLGMLGYISPITAWEWEGLDPSLEYERIQMAREGMIEPYRALVPDLSPSQNPARFNELAESLLESLENVSSAYRSKADIMMTARTRGHQKLMGSLWRFIEADLHTGDKMAAADKLDDLGKYLTQASYLIRSESAGSIENVKDRSAEQVEIMLENNGRGTTLLRNAAVTSQRINTNVDRRPATAKGIL